MKLFVVKSMVSIALITVSLSVNDFVSPYGNPSSTILAQFPPRPIPRKPDFKDIRDDDDREDRKERLENICDRRLDEDDLDDCREEIKENRQDDRDSHRRFLGRNITK
ncbi:MAG: hypothetical protein AAF298_21450 [Cyanobacteria bacterium P01_A01_bin.40]